MIYTYDDLCPSNLDNWKYWDKVKEAHPDLKVIAFTIANHQNKELITDSKEFYDWWLTHKEWVEIAVHGYDHLYPPEAFRSDTELEEQITKALEVLRPFMPLKYGYRSPGFRWCKSLEPILKKHGFSYVAYSEHIKILETNELRLPVFNTHCTFDKFDQPIGQVWKNFV
jgi:predicted deacetylase